MIGRTYSNMAEKKKLLSSYISMIGTVYYLNVVVFSCNFITIEIS